MKDSTTVGTIMECAFVGRAVDFDITRFALRETRNFDVFFSK